MRFKLGEIFFDFTPRPQLKLTSSNGLWKQSCGASNILKFESWNLAMAFLNSQNVIHFFLQASFLESRNLGCKQAGRFERPFYVSHRSLIYACYRSDVLRDTHTNTWYYYYWLQKRRNLFLSFAYSIFPKFFRKSIDYFHRYTDTCKRIGEDS